ncbi:MAG: gamma-glutamylcyclotransferase family protein [Pseudomonadota bacterium]
MIDLFVYGTLKKGYPNHTGYLDNSYFKGIFKTVAKFPLVIAGKRFTPVMMPEPGIGYHVIGELYSINEETLIKIDFLESIGKSYGYTRNNLEVINLENEFSIQCYSYFKGRDKLKLIHTEYLEKYTDARYLKK